MQYFPVSPLIFTRPLLLPCLLVPAATESFLQVWNIVLIVIGVVAFVVGDAIAAALGTWLFVKTDQKTGKLSIAQCQKEWYIASYNCVY